MAKELKDMIDPEKLKNQTKKEDEKTEEVKEAEMEKEEKEEVVEVVKSKLSKNSEKLLNQVLDSETRFMMLQSFLSACCNLQDDKKVGEAYRQYVLLNLKMNELVVLGKKGAMPGIVKSPYFRYGYDYTTYLEYMERDKGQVVDLWEDVKKAREVYQNFVKEHRFSSDDKKLMKTITQPEIQKYVKAFGPYGWKFPT